LPYSAIRTLIIARTGLPIVDIVIPLFNEREGLLKFHKLLAATALPEGYSRRYIYVNDGSTDGTQDLLEHLAAAEPEITVIKLSRNFGHQAALSAGLDAADGDIVIMMDGDGQHPPLLIPEMLRLHTAGYDIVQGQRLEDATELGLFKRVTSRSFYSLLSHIGEINLPPGASDFRLISRRALEALRGLPEYHRFLRGMIVWIGFANVVLPYHAGRRLGGSTQYSLKRMFRLASDGLFSFSLVPLRIALLLGVAFIALSALELAYVAFMWFGGRREQLVPGWTSLILMITFSNAITMILFGILGIYIGMIFQEVKRRPVYIVQSKVSDVQENDCRPR
jgi:polyisoprenyl-phosphate glycosyltransferase